MTSCDLLFDRHRHHGELSETGWDQGEAHAFVSEWLANCIGGEPHEGDQTIYSGSSGVLLAWTDLTVRRGATPANALEKLAGLPPHTTPTPALLTGALGVEVIRACSGGDPKGAVKLCEQVLEGRRMDPLTGVAATLRACLFLEYHSVEGPWSALLKLGGEALEEGWTETQSGVWTWTYRTASGVDVRYLGAGHGAVGNVSALLAVEPSMKRRTIIRDRIQSTLARLQTTTQFGTNWPATHGPPGDTTYRLNWCHGAPGVISSLAVHAAPRSDELAMLVNAGDLIWHAGPHRHSAGLCHGTAGNAHALARLHHATGDTLWLHRAQAMARHALRSASNDDPSLWTGAAGIAWLVQSLLDGRDALLGLESLGAAFDHRRQVSLTPRASP